MKIGIMQPYFLPYLGYWQLINAVDIFVVYDNIKMTQKSWIRRNRILNNNGQPQLFSLPLKADSDFLDVRERYLVDNISEEVGSILKKIKAYYSKAPYYSEIFPLIERIFTYNDKNLFNYIFYSIKEITELLNIKTKIVISSNIDMDHSLKNVNRVIEICKKLNGDHYINPIGGTELYTKEQFAEHGILLNFIKMRDIQYKQYNFTFQPSLSIIDVLMFNSIDNVKQMLNLYDLI